MRTHLEDPSRVEVGQAWDSNYDGEHTLVIVVEVRDTLVAPGSIYERTRRNAHVYVVQDTRYEGHVISYSESHMRRYFRRVS